MKQGTKVKVVDRTNGHEFQIGEVVTRVYAAYDTIAYGGLAFQSDRCSGVWYMQPDEYEILNDGEGEDK